MKNRGGCPDFLRVAVLLLQTVTIGTVYEPMIRGRSRGNGIVGRHSIDGGPNRVIDPECLLIVMMCFAQGGCLDSLGRCGLLLVFDAAAVSRLAKSLVEGDDQHCSPLDFAEHEEAGIGHDEAASELGNDFSGNDAGRTEIRIQLLAISSLSVTNEKIGIQSCQLAAASR